MNPALRYIVFGLSAAMLACQLSGCGLMRDAAEPELKEDALAFEVDPVRYRVEIKVEGLPAGESAGEIRSAMEKHSQLVLLKEKHPDGLLSLIRRARNDEENAVKLLHSLGYYEGRADSGVVGPAGQDGMAEAILTLHAGPRYTIGNVRLDYKPAPVELPEFPGVKKVPLPQTLEGVVPGAPAKAELLLAAVAALPGDMEEAGYPEGRVSSTRYTLDRISKTLNAEVVVDPGYGALMGAPVISGSQAVDTDYLKKLVTWQEGQPWDSRLIMKYREELQRTGLFRGVDVKPAPIASVTGTQAASSSGSEASAAGVPDASSEAVASDVSPSVSSASDGAIVELPALVELKDGRFRSASASARYSTDIGMGVQAEWQHRNLFGAGEKLTLKAPWAQDKRGVQADFEKPCFGHRDQKLLAGASYLNEETDAYETKAQNAYVGLERKLSPTWWASVKLFAESGSVIRDDEENYHYGSVIFNVRRDTRDSMLNPTTGTFLQLEAAPTSGYYDGAFSGVIGKMSASAYYAPFDTDWLVLAGRLAVGTFWGAEMSNIPPNLRFYCGGGGSVRGYSYQAIGPKDRYGDPEGGRAFQEVNLEARFRVTKDIGIVPFLDGGMVYSEEYPKLFQDFQWGAGIGLRYYTPIGPIRFDVAVPLDKKEDDRGWQIYISIGQAF